AEGHDVAGFDSEPEAGVIGRERGAVADFSTSLPEALDGGELACVCGRVAQLPALVAASLDAAPDGCVVSDVGSTKARLVEAGGDQPRVFGGAPVWRAPRP